MKRKFQFIKWIYLRIICVVLLLSLIAFYASCCVTFISPDFRNTIYIRDLETEEPVFGVRIIDRRKLSMSEELFLKDSILFGPSYENKFTDETGKVSFDLKGSSYACMTKEPGSKLITINEQSFVLNVKKLKCYSYPDIFSLNEDGTLNVNYKEVEKLRRYEQNYVKAAASINKMDFINFYFHNDGKENFRLSYSSFHIKEPKHIVRLSKYFVSWKIGEPPHPKKMLVGLDTAKPFKITEVKVEPEGLFTVELVPATSLEEVKDYSIAEKYGIKNVYILTITPKTTEREFQAESISFKTEPAVSGGYIEPYFDWVRFLVQKPSPTGE